MELPDAAAWRAAFGGSPGMFDYVSQKVSISEALALANIIWPIFVEVRGCVLLKERFDEQAFSAWWEQLHGDRAAIERVINHLHLWDLFEASDSNLEAAIRELAHFFAECWRCAATGTFPGRAFVVTVSDGDEDYGPTITLYSSDETTRTTQ